MAMGESDATTISTITRIPNASIWLVIAGVFGIGLGVGPALHGKADASTTAAIYNRVERAENLATTANERSLSLYIQMEAMRSDLLSRSADRYTKGEIDAFSRAGEREHKLLQQDAASRDRQIDKLQKDADAAYKR